MSNTIESKGRSVEEAISEALLRTGWRRDEVDVTVLEQPKGGFLGLIGSKQAKVRVERKGGGDRRGRRDEAQFGDRRGGRDRGRERDNRDRAGGERDQRGGRTEPAGQPRSEQAASEPRRDGGRGDARGNRERDQRGGRGRDRDRPRQESGTREAGARETGARDAGNRDAGARDAGVRDTGARGAAATVDPAAGRMSGDEEGGRNSRRRRRRTSRPREDGTVETPGNIDIETSGITNPPTEFAAPQPEPIAPPVVDAPRAEPEAAPRPTPAATVEPTATTMVEFTARALDRATPYPRSATLAKAELLQGVATDLMRLSGFPCRCEVKEGEYDLVKLIVEDRSASVLVGRYGAAVDAVEHLVEKIASQAAGDRVRMNLDVNNFRRRREEHLVQVTRSAVREVRETGEPVHFDPLCARERRIIHLQVIDIPGLATYTVQDENGKHVVLATEEQARAAAGEAYLGHDDDLSAEDAAAHDASAPANPAPEQVAGDENDTRA